MPDDDLGALAGRLRTGVARVVRSTRTGDYLPPRFAAVLAQLDRDGGLTPHELAVRLRMRRQWIAVTLGELERRGYITREGGRASGRAAGRVGIIRITESGRQRLGQERLRREQEVASGLASMPPARATWSS